MFETGKRKNSEFRRLGEEGQKEGEEKGNGGGGGEGDGRGEGWEGLEGEGGAEGGEEKMAFLQPHTNYVRIKRTPSRSTKRFRKVSATGAGRLRGGGGGGGGWGGTFFVSY